MANPKPTRQTFKTQAERLADDALAQLRMDTDHRIKSTRIYTPYDGAELRNTCNRPGALDGHKLPSRISDTLHHPDGSSSHDPIPSPLPKTIIWSDK